ncbi:hypothetical protein D3C75_796010 [compost metagenome]
MVMDQRVQLVRFLRGHVFKDTLVLRPDLLQLLLTEHVQPPVSDIMHIGLLDQIPQEFPSGQPEKGSVERIVQVEKMLRGILFMDSSLLPVQNLLQLMNTLQHQMRREIFHDLFFQDAAQINNLFNRLQIYERNQVALLRIDINIGFQTELFQHISQRGPRNLEPFG